MYYEFPFWVTLILIAAVLGAIQGTCAYLILAERKISAWVQDRLGPNRVGPYGALQPLADIIKLLTKEQFRPRTSIAFLFTAAPIISVLTAGAAFALIPFGDTQDIFGTQVGLYGVDLSIGVLYLFAFTLSGRQERSRRDLTRLIENLALEQFRATGHPEQFAGGVAIAGGMRVNRVLRDRRDRSGHRHHVPERELDKWEGEGGNVPSVPTPVPPVRPEPERFAATPLRRLRPDVHR